MISSCCLCISLIFWLSMWYVWYKRKVGDQFFFQNYMSVVFVNAYSCPSETTCSGKISQAFQRVLLWYSLTKLVLVSRRDL
jgi:hypothetical protein